MDRVVFFIISFSILCIPILHVSDPILFRLTARGALIIPDSAWCLSTACQRTAGNISGHSQGLVSLRSAIDVVVVPHLVKLRAAIIMRSLAGLGLVVPGAAAANVGNDAVAVGQRGLDVGKRVRGSVGRMDVGVGEPAPGGEGLVVGDDGLEELEEVVVFAGLGSLYDVIVS